MMDDIEVLQCNWPYILIGTISVTCFVWFMTHWCMGIIQLEGKQEWDDLKTAFKQLINEDKQEPLPYGQYYGQPVVKPDQSSELATICQQIDLSLSEFQWTQLLYLVIILLLFFITIQIWFITQVGGFLVGLICGAAIIPVLSYFTIKYIVRSLSRLLIYTGYNKEDALTYSLNNGFALTFLYIGGIFLSFLLCWLIFAHLIKEEMSPEALNEVSIMCMGYMMGMILSAFVYREGASLMSRALKTSTFGLIREETNLNLENTFISHTTKLAYVVQAQTGQILVNYLDSALIIGFVCVAGVAALAESPEIGGSACVQKGVLSPALVLCISFLSAGIVFFFKTVFENDEAAWYTAVNIRFIVILGSIISVILIMIIPIVTIIEPIKVGELEITRSKLVVCTILGLLTNVFLICLFEWYTSHGCSPVRNLAVSSVPRIQSMNLIYANYLGGFAGFLPIFVLVFMLFVCMAVAGFVGVIYFTAGFLSILFIILPVYFVGASSSDSYKLACFATINETLGIQELHDLSKSDQFRQDLPNIQFFIFIFKRGAILLSIVVLGCTLTVSTATGQIINGLGICSCILGGASVYFIKGLNTCAIVNISKNYTKMIGSTKYQKIEQDERIYDYTYNQYIKSIWYILLNWLLITFLLVLCGVLFGEECLIGFMLGFIITTAFVMFNGIIIGQTSENARIYNEAAAEVDKNVYQHYVAAEIYSYATEETNASPLIVYLLYVVVLGYCGSLKVGEWKGQNIMFNYDIRLLTKHIYPAK